MQTFNDGKQGKCRISVGLFEVLSEKFKWQHNEMILALQYCTLIREQNENAEEWMDQIRLRASEHGYRERDRGLRVQLKMVSLIKK